MPLVKSRKFNNPTLKLIGNPAPSMLVGVTDPITGNTRTTTLRDAVNFSGVIFDSDNYKGFFLPSSVVPENEGNKAIWGDVSNTASTEIAYTNFLTDLPNGSGGFLPVKVPANSAGKLSYDGKSWNFVQGYFRTKILAELWAEIGYVNKYYGTRDYSVTGINYRSTFYLKISDRNNIRITGYSGVTNNVALIAFYDRDLNYLGFYNAPSITGIVTDFPIPPEVIPEGAVYIKASRGLTQSFALSGVYLDDSVVTDPNEDIFKSWYFRDSGHINKITGAHDTSSVGYMVSKYMRVLDSDSLEITGFSGVNNEVALIAFYDKDFKYIGYYNTETGGAVSRQRIPPESVPELAAYARVTKLAAQGQALLGLDFKYNAELNDIKSLFDRMVDKNLREQTADTGYISRINGAYVKDSNYRYSALYAITNRNNLSIGAGFDGVANNVALVAFYDAAYEFIGYYSTGTQGQVTNLTIAPENIPAAAAYCRVTITPGQRDLFTITGVKKITIFDSKEIDKLVASGINRQFNLALSEVFNEVGYINKVTGEQDTSGPAYRCTFFLKIVDRNNLVVTGFDGVTNNAALACFYDEHFNPIGVYSTGVHGPQTQVSIPAAAIPAAAVWIRCTRLSQGLYLTGISTTFTVPDLIRYADAKKTSSSGSGINSERSGRPNVDSGGHIKLENYLNTASQKYQNIHPKVIALDAPISGFSFWMAYTPYPYGSTGYENPCIAASNDLETWVTPEGLTNPLAFKPTAENNPRGYNSDTHILFNPVTTKLECWYREYNPDLGQDCIIRRVSEDGITWDVPEIIFNYGDHPTEILSPAILFDEGKYKVWYCFGSKMYYTESAGDTPDNWTAFAEVPISFATYGLHAWHMDVIKSQKGYEFAVQCYLDGHNNNSADLYYILLKDGEYAPPVKIISRGDRPTDKDYQGIYRSSILYYDETYSVFYTGIAKDGYRALYLTKGRDIDKLIGVNL